jgi:hypothetical protein
VVGELIDRIEEFAERELVATGSALLRWHVCERRIGHAGLPHDHINAS